MDSVEQHEKIAENVSGNLELMNSEIGKIWKLQVSNRRDFPKDAFLHIGFTHHRVILDFAFIHNQYHLDVFGEEQYIHLLFFNWELKCFVAVELKRGKFKTSYLG